jgi:hypothetical protein
VVGSRATAVLDTSSSDGALSVCVNGSTPAAFDELPVEQGDRVIYHLPPEDTLRVACGRFLTAVRSKGASSFGREASAALAVVEALELSCANQGAPESIAGAPAAVGRNVVALRRR